MKTYVKCNKCNNVFLVDSDDVRRYESMKDYANSLLLEYSMAMSQGMTQYAYKKMTESNLIENNAIDPYKCPSCGSTNCYIMSNDEAKKYVDQINSAKKRADEEAKLKLEREKAFSTQINPNATVEQLKERILTYIEDEEWFMAEHYIEHTLDIASDDYYLYYLKFLVLNKCKGNDDLKKKHIPFDIRNNVCAKIFRYADNAFKKQMADHNFSVVVDLACSIPDKHANQIYDTCINLIINCKLTEETELGKKLHTRVSALLKDKQGDLTNRYNFVLKCYENDNNAKYGEFLIDIFLEALKQSVEKDKSDVLDKYIDNDLLFNKFIIGEQEKIVSQLNDEYKIDGEHLKTDSQYNTVNNLLKQISRINSKINDDSNNYKSLFDSILKDLSVSFNCFMETIENKNISHDLMLEECNILLKSISRFEEYFTNNPSLLKEVSKVNNNCQERITFVKQELEEEQLKEKSRQHKVALVGGIIIIPTLVVLIIIFIIGKRIKYNNAIALLKTGDYENAYILLKELREEELIVSNKYDRAMGLINSGDYEQAYVLLDGLNYKDSEKIIISIKPDYNMAQLSKANVGDIVQFGSYEQDDLKENGREEIEWKVLAKEDGRLLLISNYILDCKPYEYKNYNIEDNPIYWETCSIRRWLNEEFFLMAFSLEERKSILNSFLHTKYKIENNDNLECVTLDKVFLLSVDEAKKYFGSNKERDCYMTDYVYHIHNSRYILETSAYDWLLRDYEYKHVFVVDGGKIEKEDEKNEYTHENITFGIRPAICVNISN